MGSLLLLFQLNLGWWANYVVKLIGFALFIIGLNELREVCRSQSDLSQSDLSQNGELKKIALVGFDPRRSVGELMEKARNGEAEANPGSVRIAVIELINKNARTCLLMCGAAALCSAAISFFKIDGLLGNFAAIILGTAVTVMSLGLFDTVMRFISENEKDQKRERRFCEDISKVRRLRSAFDRTAVCTLINLGCDILNRIIPFTAAQSFFGFLAAISKITLYVFILVTVYNFNIVRADCNGKYDSQIK